MEESFPRRTVQGWFLCGAPGCTLSPLNYWKQHGQYFSEKNQLMYLNSGLEGEESVYVTSDDGFYRLKGYSIYYDKNQMMQDYMICRKDVRRVESGAGDRVIRDFRERMEDRKKGSGQPEAYSQKSGTSVQYHVHGDSGGRRGHDEQLPENAGDGDGTGSVLPEGASPGIRTEKSGRRAHR